MRMMNLKCPNCGAHLDIDQDLDNIYCQYCGALVYSKLDSHTKEEYTHVTRDETEIERLKYQKYVYDKEQEKIAKEAEKKKDNKFLIAALILLGLGLIWASDGSSSPVGGVCLIISIVLFVIYYKNRKKHS